MVRNARTTSKLKKKEAEDNVEKGNANLDLDDLSDVSDASFTSTSSNKVLLDLQDTQCS